MLKSILIPMLFVFLWSTGFIGSKLGMPYVEPLTFLLVRMTITAALLIVVLLAINAKWPKNPWDYFHSAIAGVLIHGMYLGGVYLAISMGIDAGLSALIVGLQPLLTVTLAFLWLRESLGHSKIFGIVTGFAGVSLVISQSGIGFSGVSYLGVFFCFSGLVAITLGTIYQKRFCTEIDLLPSVCIQYIANIAFLGPLAMTFETMEINWTPTFIFALAWLVLVLSLGAVFLLMYLIKNGEAGNVASLFYLVPPIVAVEAWLLFGETLNVWSCVGMLLCVAGVMLVVSNPFSRTPQKSV